MYVHCHNCKWEQDDFYSVDGYNPAHFLATLTKDLCGDINQPIRVNDGASEITMREYIARYFEHFAKHIREMKWITADQFYADPNKVCPKCGSDNLDLD